MIRHEQPFTVFRPPLPCKLFGYVDDSSVTEKVGGIRVMNACQRYFRYARIPVEVGQEMPPTCSASSVRKIDNGFASYVRDQMKIPRPPTRLTPYLSISRPTGIRKSA